MTSPQFTLVVQSTTKKGRTTMIRVTKPIARRLFRQGKVIHLVPCKCRPEDPEWKGGICINHESDELYFDRLVADFIYQNCNDKEGYYPHYYIEEGE